MPKVHEGKPALGLMIGIGPGKEHGEESEGLSPEEVHLRKRHEALACLKAIRDMDPEAFLRCFEELHALDHESWEHEEGEEDGEHPEPDEAEEEMG